MSHVIEKSSEELVIRIPISELNGRQEEFLDYIDYCLIGFKSEITQSDVDEMVAESKGVWWKENKHRFKDVPGFEGLV
ncbi:hypothetical protein [Neolewinella antarctica]|uniref:Uncharacterized protein n=1 Tax=Neolewinella antarctica TaxID=442734 RepID=A0ABX0XG11_9BACT|nr:hypothetical protein [Neolewinella antarctica]NJC28171.1 hypothetical protein [Neolewinella antarctica]